MMIKNTLSSQQAAFMLFMILLGGSYIYVPPTLALQSAWLSALVGAIAGLCLIFILLKLQSLFPQTGIIKICEQLLGKIPGKIIGGLYVWAVFVLAFSLVHDNCLVLVVFYAAMTCLFIRTILISPAVYILYKGINSVARLSELFSWPALLLSILAFIISIPRLHPAFLIPLAGTASIIKGAIQSVGSPFALIGLLAFYLPYIDDLARNKKYIFIWYSIVVGILVLKDIFVVGILSPEITLNYRYPLLEVLRLDVFAGFQRVELFFFLAWFLMSFIATLAAYQSLALGIQSLFSLPDYRFLVIPLGMGLVIFSLYTFQSDIDFQNLRILILPLHNFLLLFSIPTLLLIIARVKRVTIKPAIKS